MKLDEIYRVENAAIVEAIKDDPVFLRCQLELLATRERMGIAQEVGKTRLLDELSLKHRDLVACRIALLKPYYERAETEEQDRLRQLHGTAA